MGKKNKTGSGMKIPDHISESLETMFWVRKNLKSLVRIRIRNLFDPGSGIRDGIIRIRDKHLGSATLVLSWYRGVYGSETAEHVVYRYRT
jgi:hypothetical protein